MTAHTLTCLLFRAQSPVRAVGEVRLRAVGEVRLRVVARPEPAVAQLLARLGLELPRVPKIVANVVPKIAPSKTQPPANQATPLPN